MYYKIEVAKAVVSLIEQSAVQCTASQLRDNNYKPVHLSQIRKFVKQKTALPGTYYLLISKQKYGSLLKIALPLFAKEKEAIVILLPIIVSSNCNKYHQLKVQQLNNFMFSDEFKNIFCYTQPNTSLIPTI
ncbi:MAG TPA: hypothetical protein PK987_06505 [Ferruginibacter sp.]|nr:hypothetical protein [Ferruginibacter sp.]